MHYDYVKKGSELFADGLYSSALGQFEIATQKTVLIPLDVYDFGSYYGVREWRAGFDVRMFYTWASLAREGVALAALGRYDDSTQRFERANILLVAQFGDNPTLSKSHDAQGLAFLAAAHGRYGDSVKLFRAAMDQYRDNNSQKGYPIPSRLNWITIGIADAEIARGDLATADKALELVELRQEVEQYFETGPIPDAKATRLILTAYLR